MEKFKFEVDSALLSELGEKLVERVHIALLELVKNSYDADATEVTVKIAPQHSGGPEIHVIDNGTGMTFDAVKKYWMRIATTNKTREDVSSVYGRDRTGSKGIGRFSCRRLGTHLKLITVAKISRGKCERTEAEFDWLKFEPGTDVTTIECPGIREEVSEQTTGTTLVISGAPKNEWNKQGYNFLQRQLAVLVANRGGRRKGYQDDPGFNAKLEAPELDRDTSGNLRERLIIAGWGTLTAWIDKDGRAVCELDAMKVGKKKITGKQAFPLLSGVSLKVGILVDRKEQLRKKDILSLGMLREHILPKWGGVYVRYRNTRVYPYGEGGNDWLDIDRDRGLRRGTLFSDDLVSLARTLKGVDPGRALLQMFSARSYVGDVTIDASNKAFELKANREGFIGEESLKQLKEFVRFAIDWSTIYRAYFVRISAFEEVEEARVSFERVMKKQVNEKDIVENAVEYIQKEAKTVVPLLPRSQQKEFTRSLTTAAQAILKRDKSNQEELQHLRLVASTSTLLLIFSHEVKSFLGSLEENNAALQTIADKVHGPLVEEVQNVRRGLTDAKKRFAELLEMTSLIAVRDKESEPKRLALKTRIEKAIQCFSLITGSYDIAVDIEKVPQSILVGPILEAELFAILLNILSNSIKSIIAAKGDKKIEFVAKSESGTTVLNIRDTGVGLPEKYWEEVFVPFVADPAGTLYQSLEKRLNPEDAYIVGTGSGLGLSIVRDILRVRKGSVYFIKPHGLWKADLEVRFP